MSATEGLPAPPLSVEPGAPEGRTGALTALCPYLATVDGNWRSSRPDRDHRCTAVAPPVQLAPEKQRRLCLVADHMQCATYGAAAVAHPEPRDRVGRPSRPVARTTPVVLDHGRLDLRIPALRADHVSGQAVLVAILGIALGIVLFARPTGITGPAGAFGTDSSVSPRPSAVAPTDATGTSPTDTPIDPSASDQTPGPGGGTDPTGAPSGSPPTVPPSQGPATSGATYRVRSGDTLIAIAARFGTTTRVLADLNGIRDPSKLQIGQILRLPDRS